MIRIRLTIDLGRRDKKPDDDITIDLVGTHRDIPVATYDNGFLPNDDDRRIK